MVISSLYPLLTTQHSNNKKLQSVIKDTEKGDIHFDLLSTTQNGNRLYLIRYQPSDRLSTNGYNLL